MRLLSLLSAFALTAGALAGNRSQQGFVKHYAGFAGVDLAHSATEDWLSLPARRPLLEGLLQQAMGSINAQRAMCEDAQAPVALALKDVVSAYHQTGTDAIFITVKCPDTKLNTHFYFNKKSAAKKTGLRAGKDLAAADFMLHHQVPAACHMMDRQSEHGELVKPESSITKHAVEHVQAALDKRVESLCKGKRPAGSLKVDRVLHSSVQVVNGELVKMAVTVEDSLASAKDAGRSHSVHKARVLTEYVMDGEEEKPLVTVGLFTPEHCNMEDNMESKNDCIAEFLCNPEGLVSTVPVAEMDGDDSMSATEIADFYAMANGGRTLEDRMRFLQTPVLIRDAEGKIVQVTEKIDMEKIIQRPVKLGAKARGDDDSDADEGAGRQGDEFDWDSLPDDYDPRNVPEKAKCFPWYNVGNQGGCGSCWAFAGTMVASDRQCLVDGSNIVDGQFYGMSIQQVLSCNKWGRGCDGGDPTMVFETIIKNGITWASDYPYTVGCWKDVDSTTSQDKGSDEDCDSYKNAPRHETPCKCQEDVSSMPACPSNPPLAKAFGAKRYGRVPVPGYDPAIPVQVSRDAVVKIIQRELLLGGPVVASLLIYEDFRLIFGKRKNLQAVYRHKWGEMVGAHAVVIIGWGVERKEGKETPYWLVRNSWGTNWGEGGYFRIKRGSNECGIEADISFVEMLPRTEAVQPEHAPTADEHVQLKVALTDKVSSHISSEFVAPAKEGKAPDASSKGLFLHVTFECTTNCGFKSGFVQDVETDKLDIAERKRIDEENRKKPAEERPRERKHPMNAGDHVDGGEFMDGDLTNAIALEVVETAKGDTFEVKFDMTQLPGGPKGQTVVFYLTAYPTYDDIRVRTAKFSLALPDLDDLAVRLPDVVGEKNGFYAECLKQCDDLICETDAQGHTVKMNLKAFCSCHFDSLVRHFEKTPDVTAIPPLPAMCTGHGGAALVKAVESKNRDLLSFITSHGASLNAGAAETGRTALMAAVEMQMPEYVDLLLGHGASPNTAGNLVGHMPLHAAIQHKDTVIVEALIKAGADVLARDKDNRVALHRLASHHNLKAVEFLLTQVPEELRCKQLSALDLHRFTPLHLTAQKGDAEMLTLLISSFRDNKCTFITVTEAAEAAEAYLNLRAAMNMTASLLAAGSGMPDAVRVLEEAGADLNLRSMDGSCVLTSAAALGHANVVEYLVRRGHDALSTKIEGGIEARGAKGPTALYLSAMNNHPEVAKVLLKYGANVNNPCMDPAYGQPWTPLMGAVQWGAHETVDVLLADPNIIMDMTVGGDKAFGFTALRTAIISKSVPMIKKFCKAGVKMNVPGASRPMPLCLATLLRDEAVVDALLEDDCGADMFIECAELATIPPVVAAYLKNGPMTKAFLSKMSQADRKTFYNTEYKLLLNGNEPNPANHRFSPVFTPFEGACSNDMGEKTAIDVINVMLDHGADINQRMQDGRSTCFLQALANGRGDIARNLVEQRGAPMIPKGSDMTAVDVANVAVVFKNFAGLELVLEKLGDEIDRAERFNAKGKNLVHIAAAGDWLHGLAHLLNRNIEDAEKPTRDSVGETPFGLAVCGGKRQTAHLLLTAAKIQNIDAKLCKPVVRAAAAGMDEVIAELLKRPQNSVWDAMKSRSGATARVIVETPLYNAIFFDQPTTVANLLKIMDAQADGKEKLAAFAKSIEAEEAFFATATFETAETLEAVLARKDLGFDVNAYVDWSVHGPQHVWRYNIQNNPQALARTPISFAAMAGSEATVSALFAHGAVDKEKRALVGACAAKKFNVLPLIAAHHKMELPQDEAMWEEWCNGPLEDFLREHMKPKNMPKLVNM